MAEATTLVKYLAAHGGYSRRDVTELIKQGKVTVNGSVVKEPWQEVVAGDDIRLDGKKVVQAKKVYFLLNKPTGYITTMEDNLGREDVSLLMKGATRERIFPIGRLDRDTTGLLIFTNDGELAQQLSHPRFNMKKEYMVTLDKPVNPEHLKLMFKGIFLRDGKARVDRAALVPGKRKYVAIIEIHSGKKHIIRRMFEHFGYEVRELDRIDYAGLSKKGLALGKWRALTEEEVTSLKTMAQDAAKKARKPRTGQKRPKFDDKQRRPSGKSFGAGLQKNSRFERTDRPDIRKKKSLIVGTEEWFNQQDLPEERSRSRDDRSDRKDLTNRSKPQRTDVRTSFRRSDSSVHSDYTAKRTTKSHKDRDERASWQENKQSKFDVESWFNEGDDERPTRSRSRDGDKSRFRVNRDSRDDRSERFSSRERRGLDETGDARIQRRTNFREDSNRFDGRSQSRDDRSERPNWRTKRESDSDSALSKPRKSPYKPRTGGSSNMVSTKPAFKRTKPGGGKPRGGSKKR